MPRDLHGDSFRDPGSNHIPYGCSPEIVEEARADLRGCASCPPCLVKSLHRAGAAFIQEDIRQKSLSLAPTVKQKTLQIIVQVQGAAFVILRLAWIQRHNALIQIHLRPF